MKQAPYYHLTPVTKREFERDLYPCKKCPATLTCGKNRTCAQFHFFHKSLTK